MSDTPPVTAPGLRGFSRKFFWLGFVLILVAGATLVLRRTSDKPEWPQENDFPGIVSVNVRHFDTNISGDVTASVAVRNDSDNFLEFGYGVQIHVAQGWAHTNGNSTQLLMRTDTDSSLPPGSERVFAVTRPGSGDSWRVVAICWTPADKDQPQGPPIQYYSRELPR